MLNKEYAQVENSRYVHKEYMYALERIQHLSCKSATIKIGGKSELERSLQNDSVDDAIKACSSAVKHGYYYGNNLAIFKALKEVTPTLEDPFQKKIANALWETFCRVILTIHQNKNPDTRMEFVKDVINKCLDNEVCYDLTTEEYNRDVINSIKTDIEIIKGSISMVGTLMSANQYIASQVKLTAAKKNQ
jgi:chaperonin GroEL (HSP60 family)